MDLSIKLNTLSEEHAVQDLNQMLDQAKVWISWSGERMVSVNGYEGAVAINEFAKAYLLLSYSTIHPDSSLAEKYTCYTLWERVEKLYSDCDELVQSSLFFKYFIYWKEYQYEIHNGLDGRLMQIGDCSVGKGTLFRFTPQEFRDYWPTEEPFGKATCWYDGGRFDWWIATKELVEDALKKLNQNLAQST